MKYYFSTNESIVIFPHSTVVIIKFLHLNSTTKFFVALTSSMPVMKIIKSKSSFLCMSLHWNVNGKTVFSDFLCINLFFELSSSSLSLSSHSLLLLLSLLSWLYFFEWRLHKRKLLKPVSHRVYGIKISYKIRTKFSILCRLLLNTCKMLMYETTQARAGKIEHRKIWSWSVWKKNKGVWGRKGEWDRLGRQSLFLFHSYKNKKWNMLISFR